MKILVSVTFTPDMPEHRTVEAESTLDAVRSALASEEASRRFARCVAKGGGSIVISAFAARGKEAPGSVSRAPMEGGLALE